MASGKKFRAKGISVDGFGRMRGNAGKRASYARHKYRLSYYKLGGTYFFICLFFEKKTSIFQKKRAKTILKARDYFWGEMWCLMTKMNKAFFVGNKVLNTFFNNQFFEKKKIIFWENSEKPFFWEGGVRPIFGETGVLAKHKYNLFYRKLGGEYIYRIWIFRRCFSLRWHEASTLEWQRRFH